MKKTIYLLSTTLMILASCSSPEKEVAERTCSCMDPIIQFQQDKKVLELDEWWNSLDYEAKGSIAIMGTIPEGIDKGKVKQFQENKKKGEQLKKDLDSCINAIQDEYGKEKIKEEEFAKKMRIELREICPETAKASGI